MKRSRGAEVQRCRGAKVERCRGAEVQRCSGAWYRGAEVQRCRGGEVQGAPVGGLEQAVGNVVAPRTLNPALQHLLHPRSPEHLQGRRGGGREEEGGAEREGGGEGE